MLVKKTNLTRCTHCGKTQHCPECGTHYAERAPINKIGLFIICLLLGFLGIHRFIVGKIGTGLLMLFTAGGLGIWVIVDLILIVTYNFTDQKGRVI